MTTTETRKVKLKKQNQALEVLKRMSRNPMTMIAFAVLVLEILVAFLGPVLAPQDPMFMDFSNMNCPPSAEHIMGTDDMGRDIFSRILVGTRYSLGLGFGAVVLTMILGVTLGTIAGYFGGNVDTVIMRFVDIFQATPGTLMCIAISAALGNGYFYTILALAIGSIPPFIRMPRGAIMNIRNVEYLEAADAVNCGTLRTIFTHVLPNSFSPVIVQSTMSIARTILTAASLSYIGLGVQQPTPEWGAMLAGARNYLRDYPYMLIFPGLAIVITVLALNIVGDGLRDALDPRLKD